MEWAGAATLGLDQERWFEGLLRWLTPIVGVETAGGALCAATYDGQGTLAEDPKPGPPASHEAILAALGVAPAAAAAAAEALRREDVTPEDLCCGGLPSDDELAAAGVGEEARRALTRLRQPAAPEVD